MFKKRRKDAAGLPVSPAAPSHPGHVASPSPSAATSPHNARDVSSPGQGFDFDLPSPSFAHDGRPQTSDGIASRKGSVSPKPPVLPDIVRVSSQRETGLMNFGELMGSLEEPGAIVGETHMKVGKDASVQPGSRPAANRNVSAPLRPSGPRPEPWSKPTPSEALQMEPSLFPLKTPPPPLDTDLPMGRAFVDARDKPYGRPPFRPQLQTTTSSPDLRSQMRPQTADPSTTSPISARPADPNARIGPMHSAGTPLERPPSSAPTNYSGTTARSKFSSRSTAAGSDAFVPTIGTPYTNTSSSFPLPQHVATRPKNLGGTSTLGGVDVPTHHSSSSPVVKVEKRKTKLLNPMALLSRRRTGQDDEALAGVRAAQAQALQRQKNVVTRGIDNLPEGFDPRIRGKVVHDFSAPREPRRMFSYNDALDPWGEMQRRNRGMQEPFTHSSPDQRHVSESSPGRSVHTPMFKEHLSDNGQDASSAAAVQAERLENKAFLNRAGQFSPPGAFPLFTRKNQDVAPHGADNRVSGDLPLPGRREAERDSHMSAASSGVSPITQRSSAVAVTDATRQSISSAVSPITNRSSAVAGTATDITGASSSPVSPATSDRYGLPLPRTDSRPASEVSKGSLEGGRPKAPAEGSRLSGADGKPLGSESAAEESINSNSWHVTAISPIVEEQTPKLGNGFTPLPTQPPPVTRQMSDERSISNSSNVSSPLPTPDAQTSEDAPRLVQKRSDAVGHTNRNVSGAKPKHRVSNASRFSFQFGGESAAEELALEEKARRLGVSPRTPQVASSPPADDLDDDYFDEDAMNDMDEMEFEAQREGEIGGLDDFATPVAPAIQESPTFLMANARKQLQIDDESDGVSEVDSADETPYWMHDDFRSYTHTREPSAVDGPANVPSSTSPGKLKLNTNLTPGGNAFYMHPQAAFGHAESHAPPQRPALPHRDSGNSERNRAASGLSFGAGTQSSTVSPGPVGHSSSIASGSTEATGLGLSGLGGFKFVDTPDVSRPVSLEAQQKLNHYGRKASPGTFPQDATFVDSGVGYAQDHDSDDHYELDDMYFDDGGFESDMNEQSHPGATVDEADFDDDGFLDPNNRMARYKHSYAQKPVRGGFELPALGGDGPYPSFARPNSARTRSQDSQMLLQDLPLLATVDPKLIPRRNPSEDAKRLGLSSRAPPLPAMPGLSADGTAKKLQAYHATLADAANKAFAEGRFMRMPSTSTTKSVPEDAMSGADNPTRGIENEDETGWNGTYPVARSDSKKAPEYQLPPKLNFDFGFGNVNLDDSLLMDDGFDGESDDDIVAAANAEALANDDDGFYGQEFGFYANARPNSSEVQAINGGFFGADGDDGLQRQKSLKEPNLTPITERSEFSTRNSFVGHFSPLTPFTPGGARFSASHWEQNEVTTFDQLRRLKASAFGGSNASLHSDGSGLQINYAGSSAPVSARSPITPSASFGGAPPMAYGYSTDSSGSSNPGSAHPPPAAAFQHHNESPHSATMPYVPEMEPTPKRAPAAADLPTTPGTTTARRFPGKVQSHSRQSSGADSVTYVREQAPDGQGPPRWVLEKRRTSEAGQLEVFSREVLEGWAV
ncbi:hypothetical protein BDY17DRAFT_305463 [Neohortaea acidophila]|uniref:Uncharacterized protein n=1 Tax=Neohortaea acidophila TaxID=245834 RepID=A0A6A6PF65_9PEZI|nr:uncharacterized protein BDY17DRAFT_305463 [Neohortaea acidophila]KAF2478592.1 hypothetical protein BDY17DRAFT_305463 [Neohortaea acidophila]